MTTTNKISYSGGGSTPTAITITLNSLASGAARQSAAIDNTSTLYLDALVAVTFAVGTVASPNNVYVYAASSADGTNWMGCGSGNIDGVTGLDAAITLGSPTNLRLVGVVNAPTSTLTYVSPLFSVAAAFGGVLPSHWSLIVSNTAGVAFNASGCSANFTGINSTNG